MVKMVLVVQVVQVIQVVQVVRVAWVVGVVLVIKFVNVYGLHGLNYQIIEKTWDVTPVTHTLTHTHGKIEQYSVWAESAISVDEDEVWTQIVDEVKAPN